MSQRTIVEKADIAVSNLVDNGGYLNTEQSDTFIRMVQEAPTILKECRVITMNSPKKDIDKIGFASRILRKAPTSGTTLNADQRVMPTTGKITLTSKEIIAEINIPYDVLEDNIERASLEGTIMAMIAERTSVDLEEWLIQADTDSDDEYLALTDGCLKRMTSHIVNFGDADITKTLFKNALLAMPNKYLRQRNAMRHYVSPDQETAYRDTLANRMTVLGDNMATNYEPVFAYGVPVVQTALMPQNYGFFTFPKNLIMGIQRQIMIETDKDIRARSIIVVLTLRADFQIEEEDACVKFTNIKTP